MLGMMNQKKRSLIHKQKKVKKIPLFSFPKNSLEIQNRPHHLRDLSLFDNANTGPDCTRPLEKKSYELNKYF